MEIRKTHNCAVIAVRNYVFPSFPFVSAKYYGLHLLLCSCRWECVGDGEHILKVILILHLVEDPIQHPVLCIWRPMQILFHFGAGN